ncbi:hypothetical protein DFA_12340 [Cavenderia fasciculata]|uniref:Uncharacterized protein n=1 Tax=Cavenderia fasciculata TaxID=261658 RepID=F4QDE6_CACFS|nr:uncharacterized protein DFA_12340 [Cavenderia fasciculata]EGG14564.1 hypothetical protein DFA_12340 [Cavenderia fasciculata]|eukprot:XP_004366084.1 hypothetical protein DFA_12340 [Cavenderia fasciculata]
MDITFNNNNLGKSTMIFNKSTFKRFSSQFSLFSSPPPQSSTSTLNINNNNNNNNSNNNLSTSTSFGNNLNLILNNDNHHQDQIILQEAESCYISSSNIINYNLPTLPLVVQRKVIECYWRVYWFNDEINVKDRSKLALVSREWFDQSAKFFNNTIKKPFNPMKDDFYQFQKHLQNPYCLYKHFSSILFSSQFNPSEFRINYCLSQFNLILDQLIDNIEQFKLNSNNGNIDSLWENQNQNNSNNNNNNNNNMEIKIRASRNPIINLFYKFKNATLKNTNSAYNNSFQQIYSMIFDRLDTIDIKALNSYLLLPHVQKYTNTLLDLTRECNEKIIRLKNYSRGETSPIIYYHNALFQDEKIFETLEHLDATHLVSVSAPPFASLPDLLRRCKNLSFFVIRHASIKTQISAEYSMEIIQSLPPSVVKILFDFSAKTFKIPYHLLTPGRFPRLVSLFVTKEEKTTDEYYQFLDTNTHISDIRLTCCSNDTTNSLLTKVMKERKNITMWYVSCQNPSLSNSTIPSTTLTTGQSSSESQPNALYQPHLNLHVRVRYLRIDCFSSIPSNLSKYVFLQNLEIYFMDVRNESFQQLAQFVTDMQTVQCYIFEFFLLENLIIIFLNTFIKVTGICVRIEGYGAEIRKERCLWIESVIWHIKKRLCPNTGSISKPKELTNVFNEIPYFNDLLSTEKKRKEKIQSSFMINIVNPKVK